ncbi:YgiQ family radical SAM protein [uncultured Adlercreutzia sp.]|uniref:YgiQ family radical SAM protein n=2 Tax=uncultured Adlercreutzia sp. TaxID=875803 RepID=UPI00261E68AE|nr:YgiQ family radical SAM protein [uncultured Adlercreutzia sp.]MCI9262643.1 YgiQ family radical SAM protein [Eggerthellaceae bacterium]
MRAANAARKAGASAAPLSAFLPTTRAEADARGWGQLDFVYVSGDAYVDHPSFGPAIITRVLESHGYKVGIIAQPDWNDPASVAVFGEPRLGFLVSAGNMDSMVNHYTVNKKRRHEDAYTPGGEGGKRPNHAAVVYSNLIRRTFKKTPIILGGIEASLRRLAHYDYWSDSLKRSILMDSGADLVSYGMGERSIVEIADALNAGLAVSDLTFIPGTVYKTRSLEHVVDYVMLPSWDEVSSSKRAFAESFAEQYRASDPITGKRLVEAYPHDVYVVQNPPALPLTTAEMDAVYRLPYARTWHPSYDAAGGVPALAEVKFSLTSCRGCFGECSFCALTFHQGRIVTARSQESLLDEARLMIEDPDFKGYISDVGGPTANFRAPACAKQLKAGACTDKRCLGTSPCKALRADHRDYVGLLRKLRKLPGVKKVFVRSGIRFDYVLADPDPKQTFLRELTEHHVSGQLRVAPEHVSDPVLAAMGKPPRAVYDRFCQAFEDINREVGKKQYVVPYLMSSHPGSTLKEAVELAEYVRDMGFNPEQVQDFYPTPSTVSTCMYYTGLDPLTMEEIYVPRTPHEKALQRALIQYRNPANYDLVREALVKAGRTDLIGWDEKALIRPKRPKAQDGAGEGERGSRAKSGGARKRAGAGKRSGAAAERGANATSGRAGDRRAKGSSAASERGAKESRQTERPAAGKGRKRDQRDTAPAAKGFPSPACSQRPGKPPKANGRKGGIRKGR